jgi:hypothetical protein
MLEAKEQVKTHEHCASGYKLTKSVSCATKLFEKIKMANSDSELVEDFRPEVLEVIRSSDKYYNDASRHFSKAH